MDDPQSSSFSTPLPRTDWVSLSAWLFLSLAVTGILSLVAAHAPHRLRLIGLFYVVIGLAIGSATRQLGGVLQIKTAQRVIDLITALLALGGLVGCTIESMRIEEAYSRPSEADQKAIKMIERMNHSPATANQSTIDHPSLTARLHKHLQSRIRQLGNWNAPWPEIGWVVELLAGVTSAVWMSRFMRLSFDQQVTDKPLESS